MTEIFQTTNILTFGLIGPDSPLIVTVTKIFAISKNLSESKVVIIKVIWECEMSIITILASLRILRMFQLIQ